MYYDDGNHSPRPIRPVPPTYAQPPARPPLGGGQQSYGGMAPMGQGSYADYYNGMGGSGQTPYKDNYRDLMKLPYNLGRARMLQQGYNPPNNGYAIWAGQQRPQMGEQGLPLQLRGLSAVAMRGRRPRYNQQFDINGRPRGAWDYQEPQPQPFYSAVPY